MRYKQLHEREMTFVGCKRQRALAEIVQQTDVRAEFYQARAEPGVSLKGDQHQESPPETIGRISTDVSRYRLFDGRDLTPLDGAMCFVEGH